jgi:hypothetical protein
MRGIERAWVLGFAAVACIGGCGGSRATPIGMGGTSGAAGGTGGATAGAGGATAGTGGSSAGAGGVTDGGTDLASTDADGGGIPGCTGPGGKCTDFPVDPIVDPGVSINLCAAPTGAGPCIMEPQDGTLFPANWLRPRVTAQGLSGPMKIIVHSDNEANDLVVYASSNTWTMPKAIWLGLSHHVQQSPISVTVCGASGGQSTSTFTIGPAFATGQISFVAANPMFADIDEHACQTSLTGACASAMQLRGFSPGDETTVPLLGIGQVLQPSRLDSGNPAPVTCTGCHSPMPEPGYVSFVDSYPWRAATAALDSLSSAPAGSTFATVSTSGLASLQQPGWGRFSFHLPIPNTVSAYWQPGKRIGIGALGLANPLVPDFSNAPDQNDSPHLAWFNLEGAPRLPQASDNGNWAYANFTPGVNDISSGNSLGFIQHSGDMCGNTPCGAAMPVWSHDGFNIVYVSTNAAMSGRLNQENPNAGPGTGATQANPNAQRVPGMTNLYWVPFNNGNGGTATPIAVAATTAAEEYYPDLAPDDSVVAFTRVPAGEPMYNNSHAEIYVAPIAGGSALRLAANDPPACSGRISPGVNNTWARFAPDVTHGARGAYYWLIFSSARADLPPAVSSKGRTIPMQQLYLAPIFIDLGFNIAISYPAIYLWNQPTDTVNLTPEWVTYSMP